MVALPLQVSKRELSIRLRRRCGNSIGGQQKSGQQDKPSSIHTVKSRSLKVFRKAEQQHVVRKGCVPGRSLHLIRHAAFAIALYGNRQVERPDVLVALILKAWLYRQPVTWATEPQAAADQVLHLQSLITQAALHG